MRAEMYSLILSLNSAVDSDGCSTPRPGRFIPVTHCIEGSLDPRAGGGVWKISPSPGFDPWISQSVASRYTD